MYNVPFFPIEITKYETNYANTLQMLQNVYANSTLSKAQVSRCVSESFTDDFHFQRPLTRITGENVDRIKRRVVRAFPSDCWLPARNEVCLYPSSNLDHNMSLNNSLRSNLTKRWITIRELAEEIEISINSCPAILTNRLRVTEITANNWMSRR